MQELIHEVFRKFLLARVKTEREADLFIQMGSLDTHILSLRTYSFWLA